MTRITTEGRQPVVYRLDYYTDEFVFGTDGRIHSAAAWRVSPAATRARPRAPN